MDPSQLRPDARSYEARQLFRACLDLIMWEAQMARRVSYRYGHRLSMLDESLRQYVVVYYLTDGRGTRQQELVEAFEAPRRTVRDGLKRLCDLDILIRDGGLYYPCSTAAEIINDEMDEFVRICERLCEAMLVYRRDMGV